MFSRKCRVNQNVDHYHKKSLVCKIEPSPMDVCDNLGDAADVAADDVGFKQKLRQDLRACQSFE